MPSRSRRNHPRKFHGESDWENMYATLQEMTNKEVNRMKTTLVTMEQRYAHYVAAVLDVKKRVSYQLFSNMMDQVVDLHNKQTTIMNSYYQNQLQQSRKEKQDLIRKNQKHQKLIQHYRTQELARKKQRFQTQSNTFGVVSSDQEMNNDIASSIDMLHLHSQSMTPLNDNAMNPFNVMPKFQMAPTLVTAPTISSLTCSNAIIPDDGAHSDASHASSSTIYDGDTKKLIKKDPMKKKKRKKKRKKKKQFKYKYQKRTDRYAFASVAAARQGDTDKTWLWCNHNKCNGDGVCGVNFIRTLKDREDQAQHYCDGDETQKLITRKFGSAFGKCTYCKGESACTRLATLEEIEAYQKRLEDANVAPNTYGGYKVRGAKQTKPLYTSKRDLNWSAKRRSPVKGRPKKKRKKRRDKSKRKRAVSVGFQSLLPRLNDSNDTGAKSHDEDANGKRRTVWANEDDRDGDDDGTTVSEINTDNAPLKRRSRKRKRAEFEDDNDSYDSSDFERDAKKQKIDRSVLNALDLDELLSTAFQYKENLEWGVDGEWCRYCGARGSTQWMAAPWGNRMLCSKHGKAWKDNKLDLSNIVEPMAIEHVINPDECTERRYLIDLIVEREKEQPMMISYLPVDGRRKSVRNMKKERAKTVDESSSESEDESSSGDSDVGKEDEDEPIAIRMNREINRHSHDGNEHDMRMIEKENERNIENVIINVDDTQDIRVTEYMNSNDPMQDEDDDILGVD